MTVYKGTKSSHGEVEGTPRPVKITNIECLKAKEKEEAKNKTTFLPNNASEYSVLHTQDTTTLPEARNSLPAIWQVQAVPLWDERTQDLHDYLHGRKGSRPDDPDLPERSRGKTIPKAPTPPSKFSRLRVKTHVDQTPSLPFPARSSTRPRPLRRGRLHLIELLVAMIAGVVVMLALVAPPLLHPPGDAPDQLGAGHAAGPARDDQGRRRTAQPAWPRASRRSRKTAARTNSGSSTPTAKKPRSQKPKSTSTRSCGTKKPKP